MIPNLTGADFFPDGLVTNHQTTLLGTDIVLTQGMFEDDFFPFPKGGICDSSLEGSLPIFV